MRLTQGKFRSGAIWLAAVLMLVSLPLTAGWIQDPGLVGAGNSAGFAVTVAPDYSWTQLYSFEEGDPAALDELLWQVAGLGPGQFLRTGNSAFNYTGTTQLLLVGSTVGLSSLPAESIAVPEPRSLALVATGLLLLAGLVCWRLRQQAPVKVKELGRR